MYLQLKTSNLYNLKKCIDLKINSKIINQYSLFLYIGVKYS